eukprot:11187465-Lingulodinium_polyedra.AAC.1
MRCPPPVVQFDWPRLVHAPTRPSGLGPSPPGAVLKRLSPAPRMAGAASSRSWSPPGGTLGHLAH